MSRKSGNRFCEKGHAQTKQDARTCAADADVGWAKSPAVSLPQKNSACAILPTRRGGQGAATRGCWARAAPNSTLSCAALICWHGAIESRDVAISPCQGRRWGLLLHDRCCRPVERSSHSAHRARSAGIPRGSNTPAVRDQCHLRPAGPHTCRLVVGSKRGDLWFCRKVPKLQLSPAADIPRYWLWAAMCQERSIHEGSKFLQVLGNEHRAREMLLHLVRPA
jgi:hypothetical protein